MNMQTYESGTEKNWNKTSSVMQECIQNCLECFQICSYVVEHCLNKGGGHADPVHIKLLDDCSRICNLSADFMIRHSEFHASTCEICAEVCSACAGSCEALALNDSMMKSCAEICKKCAASCLDMAKAQ